MDRYDISTSLIGMISLTSLTWLSHRVSVTGSDVIWNISVRSARVDIGFKYLNFLGSRWPVHPPADQTELVTRAHAGTGSSRHGSIHVGRFRPGMPSLWEHPLPELAQEGAAASRAAVSTRAGVSTRAAAVGACLTHAARGRGAPLHACAYPGATNAAHSRGVGLGNAAA